MSVSRYRSADIVRAFLFGDGPAPSVFVAIGVFVRVVSGAVFRDLEAHEVVDALYSVGISSNDADARAVLSFFIAVFDL